MSYCDWDTTDELCLRYHDEEWGVPVHDDRTQLSTLARGHAVRAQLEHDASKAGDFPGVLRRVRL